MVYDEQAHCIFFSMVTCFRNLSEGSLKEKVSVK